MFPILIQHGDGRRGHPTDTVHQNNNQKAKHCIWYWTVCSGKTRYLVTLDSRRLGQTLLVIFEQTSPKIAPFSDGRSDSNYSIIAETCRGAAGSSLKTRRNSSLIMTEILHLDDRLQTTVKLNLTSIQSLILFVRSSARREHSTLS